MVSCGTHVSNYCVHDKLTIVTIVENQVASLEEAKKAKEAEIEKYKKYLNKAKKIIESFGGSGKSTPEDSLEVQFHIYSMIPVIRCMGGFNRGIELSIQLAFWWLSL